VALSLGGAEVSPLAPEPSETSSGVAQLVALQETSLALVGTLLTLTIDSSAGVTPNSSETEAGAALSSPSASAVSVGQPILGRGGPGERADELDQQEQANPLEGPVKPIIPNVPAWMRFILGTEDAIERFDREHPVLLPGNTGDGSGTKTGADPREGALAPPSRRDAGQSEVTNPDQETKAEAADQVIDILCGRDQTAVGRSWWRDERTDLPRFRILPSDSASSDQIGISAGARSFVRSFLTSERGELNEADRVPVLRMQDGGWVFSRREPVDPADVPALLGVTSAVAAYVHLGSAGKRARSSNRWTGTRRWPRD
jgi:hypothetical protein